MQELIQKNCIFHTIIRNTDKQYKTSEEVPMAMLKEKLLTDNIKSNGDLFSSINPI